MNYATGCAFNLDDLFMNLDKSKLKITSILCDKLVHDRHKDFLDTLIAGRPLPSSLVDRSENVLAIEYALRSAIDELKAVGNFDDANKFKKIFD